MQHNLIGKTFGRLTVIEKAPNNNSNKTCWKCVCSCKDHTTIIVPTARLLNGETRSCGCFRREFASYKHFVDLSGKTFGRLKVLKRVGEISGPVRYECECSCPDHTRLIVLGNSLTTGKTQSCGCYRKERVSQLKTKWTTETEKLISTRFDDMKKRCYNEKTAAYVDYGKRGIGICDEWMQDRSKFVEWAMTSGFRPELTIDRIDNDKGYSPDNCRWVTMQEQSNNRRSNRMIEINGIKHSLTEWSRLCGTTTGVLYGKLNKDLKNLTDFIVSKLKPKMEDLNGIGAS